MNPELITRVVNLVVKNGDRVVIADSQSGRAVVVLDLETYERLSVGAASGAETSLTPPVKESKPPFFQPETKPKAPRVTAAGTSSMEYKPKDLTQEEMLDNINRDVGRWKAVTDKKITEEPRPAVQSPAPALASTGAISVLEEEERFYLEPIE